MICFWLRPARMCSRTTRWILSRFAFRLMVFFAAILLPLQNHYQQNQRADSQRRHSDPRALRRQPQVAADGINERKVVAFSGSVRSLPFLVVHLLNSRRSSGSIRHSAHLHGISANYYQRRGAVRDLLRHEAAEVLSLREIERGDCDNRDVVFRKIPALTQKQLNKLELDGVVQAALNVGKDHVVVGVERAIRVCGRNHKPDSHPRSRNQHTCHHFPFTKKYAITAAPIRIGNQFVSVACPVIAGSTTGSGTSSITGKL